MAKWSAIHTWASEKVSVTRNIFSQKSFLQRKRMEKVWICTSNVGPIRDDKEFWFFKYLEEGEKEKHLSTFETEFVILFSGTDYPVECQQEQLRKKSFSLIYFHESHLLPSRSPHPWSTLPAKRFTKKGWSWKSFLFLFGCTEKRLTGLDKTRKKKGRGQEKCPNETELPTIDLILRSFVE